MKRTVLLLFSLLLFTRLAAQEKLYPYLQAVEPNSIYINWLSKMSGPTSEVLYGLSADALSEVAKGSVIRQLSGNNYHQVKLVDLTPNTKYYYKVVSKSGATEAVSELRSFKTLPEPGKMATADGHLRFMVLGDNQLQGNDRYNRFVQAAHDLILKKWGTSGATPAGTTPDDHVAMTVMVGDQVDLGLPSHYVNVHFAKNRVLSGYLPIQTLVGNHETYGLPGLDLYHDLFVLDEFSYKGIESGTEDFFAHQAGNVLFIGFCSEKTKEADDEKQEEWLKKIIAAAETDETVDWIVSLSHRPYQTEQYIGDIYPWVRERGVPMLSKLDKYVLHIGAHHHNYARGQLKDAPVYHMISGGTAWDQYWGYGKEENYDDVQKTISQWCFQIIDVDLEKKSFSVESYSIGSVEEWVLNEYVDGFHRIKEQAPPKKPTISASQDISTTVSLKEGLKLIGSPYDSPVSELHNSTQFQVSKFKDFSVVQFENYRHYEDLFGMDGRKDKTKDLMKDVDIFETLVAVGSVERGTNYARVRYRDQNLNWSEWSDPLEFVVGEGGIDPEPKIEVREKIIPTDGPITVSYMGAKKDNKPWIGLYKYDDNTPKGEYYGWFYAASDPSNADGPQEVGTVTFEKLQEVTGNNKKVGITKAVEPGLYKCVLLHYETGMFGIQLPYNVDAMSREFYVGPEPTLRVVTELPDDGYYKVGNEIKIQVSDAPKIEKDIIQIFRMGDSPNHSEPAHRSPVSSVLVKDLTEVDGARYCTFTPSTPGYYYAAYYVEGTSTVIGNTVYLQVNEGDKKVGNIKTDKDVYDLGEPIVVSWSNTPGIPKDWIGIYQVGQDPEKHSSDESGYSYTYFDGVPYGSITIGENERPKVGGEYFAAIFTNDSYTEVTNRALFKVNDSRQVPTIEQKTDTYTYGDAPFKPATASNGKPLTLRSRNDMVVQPDNDNPSQLRIKGVGEAEVRCTVEGDAEYQPVSQNITIKVERAKLSVKAKDVEKVYDGVPYKEDGGLLYEGFVYGEDASVLFGEVKYLGAGYGATNAGTYGLEPYGLQAFNYEIDFQQGTLRIKPAPVTGVELHDQTFAYDGKSHRLEVSGTLPEGTTVVYENNDKTEPGVYNVTAKVMGNNNYEILTLTAVLTITGEAKPGDPNAPTAVEGEAPFSVAPNPAKGSLTISSPTPGRFTLIDNLGRRVRTFAIDAGETLVDLRGLQPGLYILQGDAGQSVRLVVQ